MAKTICYWRGSAEIRDDIISALVERNHGVKQVRTLEEMLDYITAYPDSVIIVDGSASQREAATRIVELANTERLYRFPVFFVSALAAKRCATLKSNYQRLTPVDIPYNLTVVLRALQLVIDPEAAARAPITIEADERSSSDKALAESQSVQQRPSAPDADEPHAPVPRSREAGTEDPSTTGGGAGRRRVDDNSAKNRERLRRNPDPANLVKTYGGEVFSIATHVSDFKDEVLIPESPSRQKVLEALAAMSKADRWAGVHSRRVAFVASALANSLRLAKPRDEAIRVAALLFNWGFMDSPRTMRLDCFRPTDVKSRDTMIRGVQASATFARERFNAQRVSDILSAAASILQGESVAVSEDVQKDAELTLLVELTDRCCWETGHWQPFGAYRAIRFLRGDQSPFRSPDLLHAMTRVIGEAVTTHVTVGNIFLSYSDPMDGATTYRSVGASSAPADIPESKMKTVQIADLKSGMRLAKPVIARDGRVILEAKVKLDDELLYHLWQLATIRALGNEIAIIS